MPAPKDPTKYNEWRRNIGESKRNPSPETRKKMSAAKIRSGTIPPSRKGTHLSETHRQKIGDGNRGVAKPPRSEEHCRKISKANKGRVVSKETLKKRSESTRGEKSCHWKGGISFEPYCVKFTKEFKERVRAFFGYRCVECGSLQNGIKLDVHHVDFNKMSCCDETTPLFVSLCHHCHGKTQGNRQFWQYWFTETINYQYGGKCYLTKEEMIINV